MVSEKVVKGKCGFFFANPKNGSMADVVKTCAAAAGISACSYIVLLE